MSDYDKKQIAELSERLLATREQREDQAAFALQMMRERDTARAELAAMRERVLACEVEDFSGSCGGFGCDAPVGEMMRAADVRAAVEGERDA
jgi:hypothetical protein